MSMGFYTQAMPTRIFADENGRELKKPIGWLFNKAHVKAARYLTLMLRREHTR